MQYSDFSVSYLLYLPYGRYLVHMEQNVTAISAATNQNIRLGILEKNSSKNAVAIKAGIPTTTFTRKLTGNGDFTLRELGKIAEALDRQLVDILPSELFETRRVA
jgi:hypothetical protein